MHNRIIERCRELRAHRPHRHSRARRTQALLCAAALVGALLASLSGTSPLGSAPAHAESAGLRPASSHNVPRILPTPQQESAAGVDFPLNRTVPVVVGGHTDGTAQASLAEVIHDAGGTAEFTRTVPNGDDAVYLGTDGDSPALARALASLKVQGAAHLAPEGYVIASGMIGGHKALVLDGRDATGTYYATQSVRQVVAGGSVPPLRVRDWPDLATRGVVEGFYGIPWTHQAILDQLAFYGAHKLNTFVYSPKDDPLIRTSWRVPYSAAQLSSMKKLVAAAAAHHVNFVYGLAPGPDVCYSSDQDFDETIAKFQQLRSIGVTAFQIGLDDIPMQLNCGQDVERFGDADDDANVAAAQSYFLNRIVSGFLQPHHLQSLKAVLTDYDGTAENAYRDTIGVLLDASIGIEWSGDATFADTITVGSADAAADSYAAEHLYVWDNFPVNDGQRNRLFLNPLTGRAPDLYTAVEGILANPMRQPYASMIAEAEYGDYDWNGPGYDPGVSQRAAIRELAGDDPGVVAALTAFVDLNQNWSPYRADTQDAPALSADIARFWSGYQDDDAARMQPLRDRLALISALPATLSRMAQPGFASDAAPWVTAAAHWARAMQQEITSLLAIRNHDAASATSATLAAVAEQNAATRPTISDLSDDDEMRRDVLTPAVGDGQFAQFSDSAMRDYNHWLSLVPAAYPAEASSDLSTFGTYVPSNMADGDLGTSYWSNQWPAPGDGVTLDLGSVRPIGSVQIHQSSSDTVLGDMIYHAELQYSTDGEDWQDAGRFESSPVIDAQFPTAVSARYVRLVALAPNPANQWVEIREFDVSGPLDELASTLPARAGHPPSAAFDAAVGTSFVSSATPGANSSLTRTLPEPQRFRSVIVVAQASGTVQAHDAHGWRTLGTVSPGSAFAQFPLSSSPITGVRILFTPGSAPPTVNELGLRSTAALRVSAPPFELGAWLWPIAAGGAAVAAAAAAVIAFGLARRRRMRHRATSGARRARSRVP